MAHGLSLRKPLLDALKHSNSPRLQQLFINVIKKEKDEKSAKSKPE